MDLPDSVVLSKGYQPTADDLASIETWFAEYDAHVAAGHIESMADMAVFPLNVVSDDSTGKGVASQWTREQFVSAMSHVVGDTSDLKMESVRTPIFLTAQLAVVITEATFTATGQAQSVRYADLLVKSDGRWRFQTMVQGGWGDNL